MPFNWNDEYIPSKADKTIDILGAKEIGGVGQLIYQPFRFVNYEMSFDGNDTTVYPVCEPGKEPIFPNDDSLTGKNLLTSLCNLAKVIDSYENKGPKEQLIAKWCLENMHPYSVDYVYAQLNDNFNITSVDADFVKEDASFEIETFMRDLGNLYNAVRYYVALEGVLFGDDNAVYDLYEEGRYFESSSDFEKYKYARVHIPDEIFKGGDSPEDLLADMQRESEYIAAHPADGEFDFNHSPYDDYDELRQRLAEFIPQFEMKLKLNPATKRYEFSADIQSVFDIAWYTLARMISEDKALEDRTNNESRDEGIMICCRNCGRFIIRKSNRQEFCDAEECQKVRNARKQKAYRDRKASEKAQTLKKKKATKK